MIEEIEEGRTLVAKNDNSYETAMKLLCYAKNLMTTFRFEWTKPNETSSYAKLKKYIIPNNWLEELLIVSYRITECFISNPEIYIEKKKLKKAKKSTNVQKNANQNISSSENMDLGSNQNLSDKYCFDTPTVFTSILLYAAVQLSQIDVIPCIIDKIVQNLICVDLTIPFFVRTDNFMAVSLIINAYSDKMSDFTLLCACIYLSRYQTFNYRCKGLIEKLEAKATQYITNTKQPEDTNDNENPPETPNNTANTNSQSTSNSDLPSAQPTDNKSIRNDHELAVSRLIIETIASVRLSYLIHNQPMKVIRERRDECFKVINEALEKCPNSFQLHYNLAYIYALLGDKDKSFESLKRSLQLKPNDARSVLFMMRLLRSHKQPRVALAFYSKARKLLENSNDQNEFNKSEHSKLKKNSHLSDKNDNCFLLEDEFNYRNVGSRNGNGNQDSRKLVDLEQIYATYESNLNPEAKELCDAAKIKYKGDNNMMAILIRIELMMNNGKEATEVFRKWINENNNDIDGNSNSFDRQSPEFFFCFAQICLESNDLPLSEKLLKKAIEIEPFNVEYQSALACVLAKLGKMDAGLERARFAVKLDPESPHAWLAVSGSSKNQEEKEEAKQKSELLQNTKVDLSNIHIIIFPEENTVLNI